MRIVYILENLVDEGELQTKSLQKT